MEDMYKAIKRAVKKLKEKTANQNGYTYVLPSPNEGKQIVIHGWIWPWEAAEMCSNVLAGKKKIEDYPCMTETDINIGKLDGGMKYKHIFIEEWKPKNNQQG